MQGKLLHAVFLPILPDLIACPDCAVGIGQRNPKQLAAQPEGRSISRTFLGRLNSLDVVDVLLLSGGGCAPLKTPGWIANLRPQVALLSIAAGDRDGLPVPETLAALEGYTLLRTDQNGWIEVSKDGERMWVEVERNSTK